MIASRGAIDGTRVLSDNAFALMTHPHTKAETLGRLRWTVTGWRSTRSTATLLCALRVAWCPFASSMQVDLDEGVGVFASINAMQGYRPNPVAQFALQLIGAAHRGQALPDPPPLNARTVANAAEFAGRFTSPAGTAVEIVVAGAELAMVRDGKRMPIDPTADGGLIVRDSALDKWPLNFQREKGLGTPRHRSGARPELVPPLALHRKPDVHVSVRVGRFHRSLPQRQSVVWQPASRQGQGTTLDRRRHPARSRRRFGVLAERPALQSRAYRICQSHRRHLHAGAAVGATTFGASWFRRRRRIHEANTARPCRSTYFIV